jgi:hypothetical protein
MTKNWKPADLRGTRHLLAERQALEEALIADNLATAARWMNLKPSYTRPYRLALDEFETPDDRWLYSPTVKAKDYSAASEGAGQVKVLGSDYDLQDVETIEPSGEHKLGDIRGNWGKGHPRFRRRDQPCGGNGGRPQGMGRNDNPSAQGG